MTKRKRPGLEVAAKIVHDTDWSKHFPGRDGTHIPQADATIIEGAPMSSPTRDPDYYLLEHPELGIERFDHPADAWRHAYQMIQHFKREIRLEDFRVSPIWLGPGLPLPKDEP